MLPPINSNPCSESMFSAAHECVQKLKRVTTLPLSRFQIVHAFCSPSARYGEKKAATFIAASKVVDKFPLNFPSNKDDFVYDKIETSKSRDAFWLVKLTVLFSDESQECAGNIISGSTIIKSQIDRLASVR